MITRLSLITLFCVATCLVSLGQSDSTTEYRQGLPVSDDDTVQNFPARDFYPKNKYKVVPPSEVPEKVLKTLNRKSVYRGWEQMPVYLDVNIDIFYVRVRSTSDTITFGLNRQGKAVAYGRKSIDDD
jgi:hypothetical protein